MGIGLSMSMGHRLEQKQSLEQKLTHSQKLELRQKLSHQIKQNLEHIFLEMNHFGYDGEDDKEREASVDELIDQIKELLPDMKLALEMEDVRQLVKQAFMKSRFELLKGDYKFTAADAIYSKHNGTFRIGPSSPPEGDKVERPTLIDAVVDPSKLQRELDLLTGLVKSGDLEGDTTAARNRMRDARNGLRIAKIYKEHIGIFTELLESMIEVQDGEKKPGRDFLIDEAFFKTLIESGIVSTRIVSQLNNSIMKDSTSYALRAIQRNGENAPAYRRIKTAFSNSIAKVILISMGIIDREVFSLQTIDTESRSDNEYVLQRMEEDTGVSVKEIKQRYNLADDGQVIFFNRYKTLHKKPSAAMDNQIRDFITQVVRNDMDEFRQVANLNGRINNLLADLGDLEDNDKGAVILEEIEGLFTNEELMNTIRKKIKTKYWPQIKALM